MEKLRCVVERVTYHNETNGYTVIRCRAKGFSELVTVVGTTASVHVGSVLLVTGIWKMDAKYGRQFSAESFEEVLPATVYGIEKYLGSGLIRGIGPKNAGKIVREFGKDTLEIIENDPDRLLTVPGIGKARVEQVKKSWQEQKEIKNIMLFLQGHDVSTSHATKIYKTYGNDSIAVVRENPYRLADDIWGIGFRTADTIAAKMGFGHERYVRLRSGLLYALNRLADDGHCYATRSLLLQKGMELLEVEDNLLSLTLDQMIREKDVITQPVLQTPGETAIYLPPFFFAETGTARRLLAIRSAPRSVSVPADCLLERVPEKTGIRYDRTQMEAVRAALQNKILILTGGPGTGKTTTTTGILTAFRQAGAGILLAAPTGRAARRLAEAAGMEAITIHRLLEAKPPEGYQRNEDNPLRGDVLLVDECSMIDLLLFYNLLKAVPDTMTIILVGDIDQLPSVGAGNVLRDLIDSGCFPVVRLTRVFRQAQASRIITNAHRINAGRMPDISNGKDSDFFFMDMDRAADRLGTEPAQAAVRTIVDLVSRRIPRYYHVPAAGIQVLTPMQRGICGAFNLNQELQKALNPDPAGRGSCVGRGEVSGMQTAGRTGGLRRGGIVFRPGDKVMQIRNNYDKEVLNGEIGFVSSADPEERTLRVRYDDREVSYDASELDELVLAYAVTIHKAQGSEYPIVVMPLLMSHYVMLQRNLLYTGVTRARKVFILAGTRKALAYTVRNVTVSARNTMLRDFLRRGAEKTPGPNAFPYRQPDQTEEASKNCRQDTGIRNTGRKK
ncbi:MAG: ATP-dependent RecD-like DNA helicase [Eubacteriales bacterium]|nr:ATP-dependent RecD-like DNA helicase [Eubacteriales bacterium]